MAVAFWEEGEDRWQYTAGYVTQRDGSSVPHKRLAIYKYSADVPYEYEPAVFPVADEFFPPSGDPAGQHAATDIVVDSSGNVYVCGYTTIGTSGNETGTNVNYVIIKYDKNLVAQWEELTEGTWQHARIYDGGNGEDKAVSLGVSSPAIVVTGTSDGGSSNDIVTLCLNHGGGYHGELWPENVYGPAGIRRWHGGVGDDTAAEIGWRAVGDGLLDVTVVGTAYKGSTAENDFVILNYTDEGIPDWVRGIDAGHDDAGTGLTTDKVGTANEIVFCGYSEMSTPGDVDYFVLRLDLDTGANYDNWDPVFQDWSGEADYAVDIALNNGIVWVTGRAEDNSVDYAGTIALDVDDGEVLGFAMYVYSTGLESRGEAIATIGSTAYLVGRTKTGVTDQDILLIKYTLADSPVELNEIWAVYWPIGNETAFDTALSVCTDEIEDVFLCGQGTAASYGLDALTVRVTD